MAYLNPDNVRHATPGLLDDRVFTRMVAPELLKALLDALRAIKPAPKGIQHDPLLLLLAESLDEAEGGVPKRLVLLAL